ncbi:MAG: ABC transporter ATP-binding protein [Dehalococcoidia bacterium]
MYFDFRLWSLTHGVRLRIAWAVFIGLLTAAAGVARLALLGWLLAEVFDGRGAGSLVVPIAGVAGVVLLRGALQFYKEMVSHHTAARVQIALRANLHEKAMELGPSYFNQQRTGDTVLSLVDGVEQLETFFGQYLPQFFVAILTPIGVFVFMAFLDLPTASIFLVSAIAALFFPALFHRMNRASSTRRREAYGEFGADFLDSIQGLATLKAFGQSEAQGRMLAVRARAVFKSTMWVLATNAFSGGLSIAAISIGAAVALGWGAYRVESGGLELGVLLVILMLGVEVFRPLRELTQLFHQGLLGISAASGVFAMQDAQPTVVDPKTIKHDMSETEPTLSFKDVTFSYPGGRKPAHDGLTFSVAAGEKIGLVGPSGAGKTSVVKLLLRLYDPDGGRVMMGGVDLRELSFDQIRGHLAVVSQDTYLFHGTVIDNLRFGNPEASPEQIEDAARASNAHSFISALPDGYGTVIGERGVRLSGGQRQRIAIARALLRDAPILVLDEALSAVDAENEHLIQEALDRLMEGRTTLIIAHRLSSVIGADRIIVLDEGRVVEEGSHSGLLASGGIYADLMRDQVVSVGSNFRSPMIGSPGPKGETREAFASEAAEMAPTEAILRAEGMNWRETGRELFRLVIPWKGKLTLTFLLGVARFSSIIGIGVASALAVAAVKDGESFGWLLVSLGVLAPLAAVLTWLESWVSHDMAFRLLAEMRIDLYRKLDQLAPAYLARRRTGDLVGMATQDVETIEYFFAHTVAPAFVAVVVPTAVLVTLFTFDPILALTLVPFLIIAAASPFLARGKVDRLGSRSREELGLLNAHAVDTLQGLNEIVAFQRGPERAAEFLARARAAVRIRLPFFRELTLQRAYLEITMGIGGLAMVGVGAWLVSEGRLDSGLLPLATLLAMASFLPISEISHTARQLADTLGATRRVFAVHSERVKVQDGPGVGVGARSVLREPQHSRERESHDLTGPLALEMDRVTFSYETMNRPALEEVSFGVESGKTLALVGPSGAGKTTAAHLFLRFWDAATGSVRINGADLREYRLDDLRNRIALVSQDTYLFNASLQHNVLIARPEASESELAEAIKSASLTDFVESLPDGLDTVVGERGTFLSGGQRQRVAIARAFLKDAPILILDEATSHLDALNERAVRNALDALKSDRTTLVIAHRLSTVREADTIVVMSDGHVAETGSHDELMVSNGMYARLVATQVGGDVAAGN